jgi:hypothetical protein
MDSNWAGVTSAGASLADLDGAFACAMWDCEHRVLTLIRDPFGVRVEVGARCLVVVDHLGGGERVQPEVGEALLEAAATRCVL